MTMLFDLPPQQILRSQSDSPFIFICEHASNYIPAAFNRLGLTEQQQQMHIAWDIGAKGTAMSLSAHFDATLILANYSRLLFDCNRAASEPTAIAEVSENIVISGNVNLDAVQRQRRIDAIALPFHHAIAQIIARRRAAGKTPIIITVHSFTPTFLGEPREVEIGVLFQGENPLASALVADLQTRCAYTVRPNEPYDANVFGSHTVVTHAISNHLPYAAIEIRQDFIGQAAGQRHFADLLKDSLQACLNDGI